MEVVRGIGVCRGFRGAGEVYRRDWEGYGGRESLQGGLGGQVGSVESCWGPGGFGGIGGGIMEVCVEASRD